MNIEERHAALEREAGELAERVLLLEKANQELTASSKELRHTLHSINAAGKNFSRNLARRTQRVVSRHVTGMAGAAVPHVGVGVLVGMAEQDVRDGCETLHELNEMLRAMDLGTVDVSRVCAIKVPGKDEVLAQVIGNWRTAYAIAAAVANQYENRLPPEPPVVPHAGASALWMAVFGVNPGASPQAQPSGMIAPRPPTPPTSPTPPTFKRP